MLYAFDNGVTLYDTGSEDAIVGSATGLTYTVKNLSKTYATWDDENKEFKFSDEKKLTYLNDINKAARDGGLIPVNGNQLEYFKYFDEYLFSDALTQALLDRGENITLDLTKDEDKNSYTASTPSGSTFWYSVILN
jgi:hypothetical protein